MKNRIIHTLLALSFALISGAANSGDNTHQRFVFVADFASDNPATAEGQARSLTAKALAHASTNGFGYGDDVLLRSIPGGDPSWDQDIVVLKAEDTHPHQLEDFILARLAILRERRLPTRSSIIWALQSLSSLDCSTPTIIYVFTNGVSAARPTETGFTSEGTSSGALNGCAVVWVGLGLNGTEGLSMSQRLGLDDLFKNIATNAGTSHEILR